MTEQIKPQAAATVTTALVEPVAAVEPKPETLHIFGPITHALAEAAVHIRNGMIFSPDMPVDIFGAVGQISFHLVRGNPDQHYVDVAKVTSAEAVELERAAYERQVQAAAKQMVEDAAKAAKQAAIAVEIAAQEKTLRALKRQAVAAQ